MFKKQEIVFLFNGPVYGLTNSLCDYFYYIRRQSGQPKLKVFIQTWELQESDLWLEAFKKKLSTYEGRVQCDIVVEKYNDSEPLQAFTRFNKNIGWNHDYIPSILGKRMWFFYTLLKGLQRINKYNKDAFVIRLEPDVSIMFNETTKEPNWDVIHWLYQGTIKTFNVLLPPHLQYYDASDIYFAAPIFPYGYSEKFFMSSISTFKKIYGEDFNILKFTDLYADIILGYMKKARHTPNFKTGKDIEHVFSNTDIIPNEGAHYIYDIIKNLKVNIPVVEAAALQAIARQNNTFSNPWVSINYGKVEEEVPLKKIRVIKDHLFQQRPENTLYGITD